MANRPRQKWERILCAAALLCICTAVGLLIWNFAAEARLAEQSSEIVREMRRLLPTITDGAADSHPGTRMPVMEIDGCDYSYLLEVPKYEKALPVRSVWAESGLSVAPVVYYGSVAEGLLIIGASGSRLSRLEPGDQICLTDMSGVRYSFSAERIEKAKEPDFEFLSMEKQGLTLFIKGKLDFQYTIIRCKATL